MDRGLFSFIIRNSARQQIVILGLTLLSLPFYYAVLDFPRQIINKGLGVNTSQFPASFRLWGQDLFYLEQQPLLVALCFAFLFAVTINGGLKYFINLARARLGELLLRQLRLTLCSLALRFPQSQFRKTSSGELVTMVTSEVEALGTFIGDAISVPALQCGLLFTAFFFIFTQDIALGFASVALLPVQIVVVPIIQRQVNRLSKKRIREVRRLSRRFSESVSMTSHLQASAAVPGELDVLDYRLGRILNLRYQIFKKKFFVKFFNNFLSQLTPFFFFLIGGYFVILGDLTVGALVAVVIAYKDVPAPWKELLGYYQDQQDARVRYEQVTSRFRARGILPINSFEAKGNGKGDKHEVILSGVSLMLNDEPVLSDVSFSVAENEHVIIIGADYQMGQILGYLLLGLDEPREGSIMINGTSSTDISRAQIAQTLAYVDGDPRFFTGTILQNLTPGLTDASSSVYVEEALKALDCCGLGQNLFDFGLDAVLDLSQDTKLQATVVEARAQIHRRLENLEEGRLFRPFRFDEYNEHATILENLFFGSFDQDLMEIDKLLEMSWFRKVLKSTGLDELLEELGLVAATYFSSGVGKNSAKTKLSAEIVELFSDRVPKLQSVTAALIDAGGSRLNKSQRRLLLNLALEMRIDRAELPLETERLMSRLVESRQVIQSNMHWSVRQAVVFFDPRAYNPSMTLRDNLLFGRPNPEGRKSVQRVASVLEEVIDTCGLRDRVVHAALDFHIGIAGSRLSREQLQELGLARALLSQAKIVVACYATSAISSQSERSIVEALGGFARTRGLVWITDRADLAQFFGRVLEFNNGSLTEKGNGHRPNGSAS